MDSFGNARKDFGMLRYVHEVNTFILLHVCIFFIRFYLIFTNQTFDNEKSFLMTGEVLKMFMDRVSLKKASFHYTLLFPDPTTYSRSTKRLGNLSELTCHSDLDPKFFFCRMSRICQRITITINRKVLDRLVSIVLADFDKSLINHMTKYEFHLR